MKLAITLPGGPADIGQVHIGYVLAQIVLKIAMDAAGRCHEQQETDENKDANSDVKQFVHVNQFTMDWPDSVNRYQPPFSD